MRMLEGASVNSLPELTAQYMAAAADVLVEEPESKRYRRSPSEMFINTMDHDKLGMSDRVLLHT